MDLKFSIDPDIRKAKVLPRHFYSDGSVFEAVREKVFARSWQWIGHEDELGDKACARPKVLLPGLLNEPLVLTRDKQGRAHCLSNVCTHRANLVVTEAGECGSLGCKYHGRRFDLAGRFRSMPEFDEVSEFPSASDDLASLRSETLGGQRFVSLDPAYSFDELVDPIRARLGDLPLQDFRFDPTRSREYTIKAHWALYVDNYLEGFHIPFVHPDLAGSVDYDSYSVETYRWANLQLARPKQGGTAFDGPLSAEDRGETMAAYYFWLFPNTMLNFYPWGLSLNVVLPQGPELTKVLFHSYVWRPELLEQGAGGSLDQVEMEDEEVVERAQIGVGSRFFVRGRYSPSREIGVHHFHRLIADALSQPG